METGDKIRRFIQDELVLDASTAIATDTPLCDGILDSIGLVELVSFIEERFGIKVDDTDLVADNFRTVGSIERYVDARAVTP